MQFTYILETHTNKPVLPKCLYTIAVSYIHVKCMHKSQKVVKGKIEEMFYIRDKKELKKSFEIFSKSCLSCLTGKRTNYGVKSGIIHAKHPREIISLDLLERPKVFGRSNKSLQAESILVISDVYSKFHAPF